MKKVIFLALIILLLNVGICSADLLEQNLYLLSNDYFEEVRSFGDAYMVKDLDYHYWYLLNKNGDRVSDINYDEVLNYDDSYITVGKKLSNGKVGYGVIDSSEKVIVPLKYKENIQVLKMHNYIKAESYDGKYYLYNKSNSAVKEIPFGQIVERLNNIVLCNEYTVEDKTINQGERVELLVYDTNLNFVFDYSGNISSADMYEYEKNVQNSDLLITSIFTPTWGIYGIINVKNERIIPAENEGIQALDNYITVKSIKEKNNTSEWDISIYGVNVPLKCYTCKIYDYDLTEQSHLYKDFELVNALYNEFSKELYLISYDEQRNEYGIRDINGNLLHSTKQNINRFISKNVLETNTAFDRGYIYIGDDMAHEGNFYESDDDFTLLDNAMNDEIILVNSREGNGLFDAKNKKYVVPNKFYSQIIPRTSEYALAQKDNKWNIINYYGEVVLSLENITINSYSEGYNRYFKVKNGKYENIFDIEKLDFIFEWKYKDILEYENYYSAKIDENFTDLINYDYEILLSTKADLAWYYNNTIDVLYDGKRQIYRIGGGEPSSWAAYGINQMNNLGLTPDKLRGLYQKNITRSEFCDIIVNIIYEKKNLSPDEIMEIIAKADTFIDTDSQNVAFCNSEGIVKGHGNKVFAPNDSITREEAAVIIHNTLKYLGIENADNENTINFADNNKISSWAKNSVNLVVSKGLIVGVDINRYDPQGKLSREQAIVICYRLLK